MSDEREAAYEPEICEECGEYVPDCACGADSAAWLRDRVHRLGGEVDQLTAENARLNELLASRSELAATTIAGLEIEVNRFRAVCKDKERHMDGWRKAADEDRARIRDLETERDAILNLCVRARYDPHAFRGTSWRAVIDTEDPFDPIRLGIFDSKDSAIAAVRKAAGLDPIFGSPIPTADGGPDA